MSDLDGARRTWLMLNRAGTKGLHSSDIIKAKFPGCTNPSQRLREVADHVGVRKRRENIGRSPGIRAWLDEYAPKDSIPVTPHSGPEGGSDTPGLSSVAVPLETERLSWYRDYCDPEHEWELLPESEARAKAMAEHHEQMGMAA